MKIKAVYVVQYGYWWKLSVFQWRALCERAAQDDGGYMLPHTQLSRKPRRVAQYGPSRGVSTSYWSQDPGYLVYQPLDWVAENFVDALAELDEKLKADTLGVSMNSQEG